MLNFKSIPKDECLTIYCHCQSKLLFIYEGYYNNPTGHIKAYIFLCESKSCNVVAVT